MPTAPMPLNESDRLAALYGLDILDTSPTPEFDAIVRAATLACGVPIGIMSLVDRDRQWFKACLGLSGVTEIPRDISLCAHTIMQRDILEIQDAEQDLLVCDNPHVTGSPKLRFYAGVPISPDGHNNVGVLCVIDHERKRLTETQREILRELGHAAAGALESHRTRARPLNGEAALRRSQEFLHHINRLAKVGGWEFDLSTSRLTWSEETYRIYGLEPARTPSFEAAMSVYAAECRPLIEAAVQRASAGEEGWDLELALLRPDNRKVWVRTIGSAIFENGKPTRLIGAIKDVTEHVEQRAAVKAATGRAALATDSAGIGLLDWDLSDNALTWNDQMFRLYGLEPGSVLTYDSWRSHCHADDLVAIDASLGRALRQTGPSGLEFRIMRCDNTARHLRATFQVVRDSSGRPVRVVGVAWDITEAHLLAAERNQKANELVEVAAHFRLLAEHANDVISWVGKDGNRRYVSPAANRIFGATPETLIEQTPVAMIHPGDRKAVMELQHNLLQGTATEGGVRFRILHPTRGLVWAEASARAMPSSDLNSPAGYVSVIRDVTERVQMETEREERERELNLANAELKHMTRQLIDARDAAERASHAKSRFLAAMSHELRTPLNGILGYAQLLCLEGGLNEQQDRRVHAMLDAGTHLLEMISSVLELSEIETEHVVVNPTEVDLFAMADSSLELVRPTANAKSLRLHRDPNQELVACRLVTDPRRLRQILLNLLGNAVKFTSSGTVEIRLRATAERRAARIEVIDTGPGIPADKRHLLFGEYARFHSDPQESVEGAGLGLAISSRLAGMIGARLGHSDNPAGGSIFWLELPLSAHDHVVEAATLVPPTAETPTPPAAEPAASSKLRILVVDDIAMNRDIAASFLRSGGHEAICAESGAEAIAAIVDGGFDVVMMDVRMPEMDGLEATRQIRALHSKHAQVPIVGLTAQAFAEQVAACTEAGMDAHLAKPYTREALLAAVGEADALRLRRIARPTRTEPSDQPPVLDAATARQIEELLDPSAIANHRQAIAGRCERLLQMLEPPDAVRQNGALLIEVAHALGGSAGMLGFARLSDRAVAFERSLQSGTQDVVARTGELAAALEMTLDQIRAVQSVTSPG